MSSYQTIPLPYGAELRLYGDAGYVETVYPDGVTVGATREDTPESRAGRIRERSRETRRTAGSADDRSSADDRQQHVHGSAGRRDDARGSSRHGGSVDAAPLPANQ